MLTDASEKMVSKAVLTCSAENFGPSANLISLLLVFLLSWVVFYHWCLDKTFLSYEAPAGFNISTLIVAQFLQVRQVSHWVTTTTPYFFEPMRTAATFKMLPDPAFVVRPPARSTLHGAKWLNTLHPRLLLT